MFNNITLYIYFFVEVKVNSLEVKLKMLADFIESNSLLYPRSIVMQLKDYIASNLNEEQTAAALHTETSSLIIAGAGS